ncbi:flagellar hook-length control protein FliK [Candidatus Ferrigenium straubiae]|jgi:flagellar hook-length control protein FliK|uniref:flagellar hook-length control protein FliK n=1 Tax=Candidatus Ferrigenium straubiae TaxID=2919506 RepID=UPI003F4AD6E3
MSNLPISSTPQPPGNAAAGTAITSAADMLAMGAQPVEPFALLLARQIDGAGLSVPDAAQTAIAIDGNATNGGADPSQKDAQDPAAAIAPGDPANTLAAILLQLPPQESKGQKTEGMQATQSLIGLSRKTDGQQSPALASSLEAGHKTPMAGSEDGQITKLLSIAPPSEAVSRAGLSGAAQSAPDTTQAVVPSMAPAAMSATSTNNTPAIATPLGSNGWAQEFSQKISWIATQQNQVAELHLNPPNLGPLDVVLKISDNQATALFTSPHGAVREAVENALPKLREILADNGIMLGNTTVSDQPPRDRSMDGFMNQDSGTAAQHRISAAPEPAGSLPEAAQTVSARRHNGMVDTFA